MRRCRNGTLLYAQLGTTTRPQSPQSSWSAGGSQDSWVMKFF